MEWRRRREKGRRKEDEEAKIGDERRGRKD